MCIRDRSSSLDYAAGRQRIPLARLALATERPYAPPLVAGASGLFRKCGNCLAISHPVWPGRRGRPARLLHGAETHGNENATRRHGRHHARLLPAAHPLLLFAEHSNRDLAARLHYPAHRRTDPPARRPPTRGRHSALRRSASGAGHPFHADYLPCLLYTSRCV